MPRPRRPAAKPKRDIKPRLAGNHHVPVPIAQIEDDKIDAIRAHHPKVTERQAQLVYNLLATGASNKAIARSLKCDASWISATMQKQHVVDFRNELVMTALGWKATRALGVMDSLLAHKSGYVRLEAARDLLDRAGLRAQPVGSQRAVIVKIDL